MLVFLEILRDCAIHYLVLTEADDCLRTRNTRIAGMDMSFLTGVFHMIVEEECDIPDTDDELDIPVPEKKN